VIHAKEAKYEVKCPNDSSKTRVCLKEDATELWVTICHIREDRFRTGAHILAVQRFPSLRDSAIAIAKRDVD
jgi:hypothetical protein